MQEQVVVRPARIEDAEPIAHLSGQLGYPASAEDVRERLTHIVGEDDHVVYVAESLRERVIGWIYIYIYIYIYLCPLVEMPLQAEIGGLVVDERHRSQGVGRRLLEQAERWAAGKGCSAVMVHSNVVREAAHRFYIRLGYRLIKTQRVFTKSLKEKPHGA